ncbi:hypothetical protein ACWDTT_31015, partial [Streptosporangium sandarakinum]
MCVTAPPAPVGSPSDRWKQTCGGLPAPSRGTPTRAARGGRAALLVGAAFLMMRALTGSGTCEQSFAC